MSTNLKVQTFNIATATLADFNALNEHNNRIRSERLPDDPPIPLDEFIQDLRSIPPFVDARLWAIWNPIGNQIIAAADLAFLRTEENQHLAQFEITVLPEYRQQSLGRQLFAQIVQTTQQENRQLLISNTIDRIPSGAAFMARIRAQKGLETHVNQLKLEELEANLINNWLARGEQLTEQFELGWWDGAYPEAQLPAIALLNDLTNQQPFGTLEIEEMHTTPEQLRQMEHNLTARGTHRWTCYLIDRSSQQFAGYTEMFWNPNRPETAHQGFTGVFPTYRNQGLGRWLKAAMLNHLIQQLPQVKYVRTGNADTNTAMLNINHALGFQPYMANALWQIDVQTAQEYLNCI